MKLVRVLSLCLIVAAIGCGGQPKTYPVRGMVVYQDGTPLKRGTVEFELISHEKPVTATSEIGLDGSFELGTFAAKDGAMPGEHRAAVIADYDIGTGVERPDELPPPDLHPKYRSFKTSELKFTVKRQANNILIEVERAPAAGE